MNFKITARGPLHPHLFLRSYASVCKPQPANHRLCLGSGGATFHPNESYPPVPNVHRRHAPPAYFPNPRLPRKERRAEERKSKKPLPTTSPNSQWIRPLIEEGIEPHPGPQHKLITKNIDGARTQTRFNDLLFRIRGEADKSKNLLAVFIQEHNRPKESRKKDRDDAATHRILWIAAHASNNQTKGHGVAIAIPFEAIERRKNESDEQARERLLRTAQRTKDGRVASVITYIESRPIRLTSAYAPASRDHGPDRVNSHDDSPDPEGDEEERQREAEEATNAKHPRVKFFEKILAPKVTSRTVLGIDANCVADPILDLHRPSATTPYDNAGATEFGRVTAELVDIAREQQGNEPGPFTSQHNTRGGGLCSTRIDKILVPHLDGFSFTHATKHGFLDLGAREGDHIAQEVTMSTLTGERGKDLSTIDPKIYQDKAFLAKLAQTIDDHLPNFDIDPTKAWEDLKGKLLKLSLDRHKETRLRNTTAATRIKERIQRLRDAMTRATAAAKTAPAEIETLQAQLRAMRPEEKTLNSSLETMAYTTRHKHDIGSAAFYRRICPRSADQWVSAIIRPFWRDPSSPEDNGRPDSKDTDPDGREVAEGFAEYYQSLFQRKSPKTSQAVDRARAALRGGRKVLAPTAESCGAEITAAEVKAHSSKLPTGKSPGPDRLPNAMYKALAGKLAEPLAKFYNDAQRKGMLPDETKNGIISVLYKKKDRTDPRNYRPITLLNSDYKILMRILTARFNTAIVQFASDPQNGFVPGGFIGENIMLLQMLQAYVEEEDYNALFIFLDFEKAFDRCSWEFLHGALEDLGFPPEPDGTPHPFTRFVQLAYSHAAPPTRQVYVNGYLSKPFPIESGVAQGCPLSPLLFICFTEVLTRMVEADKRIKGIPVNGHIFKISQYADDSTLFCTRLDWPYFAEILQIYCDATCAKENEDKREALLVGKLARQPYNAPQGGDGAPYIVPENKYTPDGTPIRALGAPIGNKLNITEWWEARIATVRQRLASLRYLRSLSLHGRNMILQSKYYGSLRYWLYFLLMSPSILRKVEADAKHLLWRSAPDLGASEQGQAKPYIHGAAHYRPQKKGGAGLMRWRSHVTAFRINWILRLLEPRRAPWKFLAEYWINKVHGRDGARAALLAPRNYKLFNCFPSQLRYFRRVLIDYEKVKPLQLTSGALTESVYAEPLWDNHRFSIRLAAASISEWIMTLNTTAVGDLFDHYTGVAFTRHEWDRFMLRMCDPKLREKPSYHEWADARHRDLVKIINNVPKKIVDMLSDEVVPITRSAPQMGEVLLLYDDNPTHIGCSESVLVGYALAGPDGKPEEEVLVDLSGNIHATGNNPPDHTHSIRAATWTTPRKKELEQDTGAPEPEEEEEDKPPSRLIGPVTLAYPLNNGWRLPYDLKMIERTKNFTICLGQASLSFILSIPYMTEYQTYRNHTDAPPNCEAVWKSKLSYKVNWPRVWNSLGTPLSDATEEKFWRKMLHRALFTNTRNPEEPDGCRVCKRHPEHAYHLVTCHMIRGDFWKKLLLFIREILPSFTPPWISASEERLIFCGQIDDKRGMAPMIALATLRHGWGQLWQHLTSLKDGKNWFPELVLLRTVHALRTAALHRHKVITINETAKIYNAPPQPAVDAASAAKPPPDPYRDLTPLLIHDDATDQAKLTDAFQKQIDLIKQAADNAIRP